MKHVNAEAAVYRFYSTDEFNTRPRFRDGVKPPYARPLKIIGNYRLEQPIACGMQGCGQIHGHGYVVLIDDNTETNTGWDCGMDHFGFDFVAMRQQYDRLEREYPRRTALRRIIDTDGARLRALVETSQQRAHGGNWLLRNLRRFEELYPSELLNMLWRHSEKGEVDIFDPDAGSDASTGPIDFEMSVGSSPNFRRPFATVRGLKIFKFDTDRWPLVEIEIELEEFLQLDVDLISIIEVVNWSQWADTLESRLAEIDSVIDEGTKFFRRSNLDLLKYLVHDPKSRELLSWIVFSSDFPEYRDMRPVGNSFWQQKLRRLIIAINQ